MADFDYITTTATIKYNNKTGHVTTYDKDCPGVEISLHFKCLACNKYLKWLEIYKANICPKCGVDFTVKHV